MPSPRLNVLSPEYPQERVTDLEEIVAVWNGEIVGDYYANGDETWANTVQLAYWRARHWQGE